MDLEYDKLSKISNCMICLDIKQYGRDFNDGVN